MRWAESALLVLLMGACTHAPVRIEPRSLTNTGSAASDRFIIAAIDNQPVAFLARPGGSPRGYDAVAAYGPAANARQVMRSVEREYGLREVNAWPIEPLHLHCAVLELPDHANRDTVLAALSQDRRVRIAQPLQIFATRSQPYNDPYVGLQHGFQQMDVAGAHPWSRGEGVKIAVIDTGIDTEHPDLRANIGAAANYVDDDSGQFRRDRHGTEMAGIIAAVANNREGIVGVAPQAQLLAYKACWQAADDADAARCNSFTLARALVAALDAHAQIINLSLAGPDDPLLRNLIQEGLRRGIIIVGAAGADTAEGRSSLMHRAGVIEVTSDDSRGGADPDLPLHAPGHEILTSLPGGHYDFASGDSVATAQVTGIIALLVARDHGLSASAALTLLRSTGVRSTSSGGSAARVDACAAVVALVGRGDCGPIG